MTLPLVLAGLLLTAPARETLKIQVNLQGESLVEGPSPDLEIVEWVGSTATRLPVSSLVSGKVLEVVASTQCVPDQSSIFLLRAGSMTTPPVEIEVSKCPGSAKIEGLMLVPAARIHGFLEAQTRDPLPDHGLLFPELCESDPQGPDGIVFDPYPFAIDEKGRFSSRMQQGCHRLRLEVPGFSFVQLGEIDVLQNGTDLGKFELEPGAELDVTVVDQGSDAVGRAVVQLYAQKDLKQVLEETYLYRPTSPLASWKTDGRGHLSRSTIPPGRYLLKAQSGDPKLAFALEGPLEFEAREIAELELVLPGWASLEVSVTGDPEILSHADHLGVQLIPGALGEWIYPAITIAEIDPFVPRKTFEKVPPGKTLIDLNWSTKEGRAYSAAERLVELVGGQDNWVELEVPAESYYRGRVLRGKDTPVSADLEFDRYSVVDSSVPFATSDDDGFFEVILPAPGSYDVRITNQELGIRTVVQDVVLEPSEKPVEIHLPENAIRGLVVDTQGMPRPDAIVTAVILLTETEGRSFDPSRVFMARGNADPQGSFLLDSVPPGTWEVTAYADQGRLVSEKHIVELSETEGAEDIKLVVDEMRRIKGVVRTADRQPVARAMIIANWAPARANVVLGTQVVPTGPDGSFDLTVEPSMPPSVNLLVQTPGQPLAAFRRSLDSSLDLRLSAGGRALILRGNRNALSWSKVLLINAEGGIIHPSSTGAPSTPIEGGTVVMTIDSLAVGSWKIVHADSFEDLREIFLNGSAPLSKTLASFTVQAGETVSVSIE